MEACSFDSEEITFQLEGRERSFDQIEKWMGCYRERIAKTKTNSSCRTQCAIGRVVLDHILVMGGNCYLCVLLSLALNILQNKGNFVATTYCCT